MMMEKEGKDRNGTEGERQRRKGKEREGKEQIRKEGKRKVEGKES